jgi:hypothetical protein
MSTALEIVADGRRSVIEPAARFEYLLALANGLLQRIVFKDRVPFVEAFDA